ncbi:MAG TPA: hypothetical protein VNH11_21940 [Pirellulales bacterium]|nr:hypothetical protein [Pirellulales bacterium]
MTMVPQLRCPEARQGRLRVRVARAAASMLVVLATAVAATGQQPPMHYRHAGQVPPGAIGSVQLQRGGPLPGYFQPVEIRAPEGAKVSIASRGQFGVARATPLEIGLLIAPVYRFKVSNIAGHEGQEVFPTIEVIDRLYPPRGQERRFPVPIEFNADDIELALDGKFVTRVVYLEDPRMALPVAEGWQDQHWFDAGPGVNAVQEADRWGRPLAIVRMGGRVPDEERGPDVYFVGGGAPFTVFRPYIERLPHERQEEEAPGPMANAPRPRIMPGGRARR